MTRKKEKWVDVTLAEFARLSGVPAESGHGEPVPGFRTLHLRHADGPDGADTRIQLLLTDEVAAALRSIRGDAAPKGK